MSESDYTILVSNSLFNLTEEGWLEFFVNDNMISAAKEINRRGDQTYATNLYTELPSDWRWVGFLGELVFDLMCYELEIPRTWHKELGAGKTDFSILNYSIGVKTVKRSVPMKLYYEAQISKRHANEPSTDYFFCCYEIETKRMVMLGGINRKEYLSQAVFFGEGEYVHPNYLIRKGHSIYNLEVSKLVRPIDWLKSLIY